MIPPWHLLFPNACNVLLRPQHHCRVMVHTKCVCFPFSYFKCSISYLSYFWNSFFDEEVILFKNSNFFFFFKNSNFLSLTFFLPCCFLHYQHFSVRPFRMISSGMALQSSWRWIINRDQIWTVQIPYSWPCLILLLHTLRMSYGTFKENLLMCKIC